MKINGSIIQYIVWGCVIIVRESATMSAVAAFHERKG
jgi:hypothetical protein